MMPLTAKWIDSAALDEVRGRIRMQDAGWNLEGRDRYARNAAKTLDVFYSH